MSGLLKSIKEEFYYLEKSNGWASSFEKITRQSFASNHKSEVAFFPENEHRNRYCNVFPYDHTRVVLRRIANDYINASHVKVPDAGLNYILTQGPLRVTVSHFWAMVWEQNVQIIVMLNRLIEKNSIKCEQYWPSQDDPFLILPDVDLKVTLVEKIAKGDYILRRLTLTDLKDQSTKITTQFHYTAWPDFGVPRKPLGFIEFVKEVKDARKIAAAEVGPPVVHCSAGIGRSGTFCIVDCFLEILQGTAPPPNNISLRSMLIKMRGQRRGLVQTSEQLRFCYVAIIAGAKVLSSPSLKKDFPKSENAECCHEASGVGSFCASPAESQKLSEPASSNKRKGNVPSKKALKKLRNS